MRFVIIATALALVGCATAAPKLNAGSEVRLTETGRTEFYASCLMAGVPTTGCRCIELKMKENHYSVSDLTRERVQKMSLQCSEELKDVLTKEIEKSQKAAEAAAEAAAPQI